MCAINERVLIGYSHARKHREMELKDFFHMKNGDGELSYFQNSFVQEEAWLMSQKILENTIQSLFSEEQVLPNCLNLNDVNVVDLGCGVGPVPLAFVTLVTRIVQKKCNDLKMKRNKIPQLQIYMNDLPSNDFNLLFRHLMNLEELKTKDDDLPTCFVKVVPGSYYDRLFPRNTLHLVHANYTLHWLIKAPRGLYDEQGISINKGNIYISETSLKEVAKAYVAQFEQDFTRFLQHRSDEVVGNGCMLLTLSGRPCSTDSFTWTSIELKLLTKALTCLVSEGLIKEEKLDEIDFPIYYASAEQLESIVKMEGSFTVENCKTMAIDVAREIEDKWERARNITNFIRAFSESLVSRHFGEEILGPLYDKLNYHAFQRLVDAQPVETYAVTILLRKK